MGNTLTEFYNCLGEPVVWCNICVIYQVDLIQNLSIQKLIISINYWSTKWPKQRGLIIDIICEKQNKNKQTAFLKYDILFGSKSSESESVTSFHIKAYNRKIANNFPGMCGLVQD